MQEQACSCTVLLLRRIMELAGKKVLIIGAARSGIAAARFLLAQGAIVALTDQKPLEKWTPEALALKEVGRGFVSG